jgi:hypothetical protein
MPVRFERHGDRFCTDSVGLYNAAENTRMLMALSRNMEAKDTLLLLQSQRISLQNNEIKNLQSDLKRVKRTRWFFLLAGLLVFL